MALKLFNRIGLRRDFNLSDLINPDSALNNILRTDSMSAGDSFTIEDIAPIKNIYVTDITAATFLTLDDIIVKFTQILVDPETGLSSLDNNDNPVAFRPFVKIKNRLDTAYFTTGEPFFFGGDGPVATYFDADDIIRQPNDLILSPAQDSSYQIGDIVLSNNNIYRVIVPNSSTSSVLVHTSGSQDGFLFERAYDAKEVYYNGRYDVITGEELTESDNFWERGFFLYGDKIRDSYLSSLGGVKWNGYFKPIVSGSHRFFIRSSGNCQFKFQDPSVFSSVETKYAQPDTAYVQSQIASSSGITQIWRGSLYNILTDNTRKFVEVRLETGLVLSTDDIVYVDSLQGQLIPKQYRISTLFSSGEENIVDRIWIEVTEDFNRKNVSLNQLPVFGTQVWADAEGNRSYIRYYPYKRRALKTYLNSIYKNLEIPSTNFTTTTNTVTFTGINADLYYYQFMENDYIYDYRLRGSDANQGVRRFVVTGLSDSSKTVTFSLDTSYTGIDSSDNNDQQARTDGTDLYVFAEDYGEFPPFGALITGTYTTGALNDIISGTTRTNNLHFVARFGTEGEDIRKKYITIDQFIPKYEESAFELTFFMKDEDINYPNRIEEKGLVIWYADENSGYNPINYKYLYDPDYEFYQIGDFRTFLDNTIPLGGTSRETGIDQRTFGKPQLLTSGDQYKTFYSTLPVNSVYVPKVRWNDISVVQNCNITLGSRKLTISDTVNTEVGNYVFPADITGIKSETILSRGTRVTEILSNLVGTGDAIISKISLQSASDASFVYFNHRGFVTALHLRPKHTNGNDIYCKAGMPIGSCTFTNTNSIAIRLITENNIDEGTTINFVNSGQSGTSQSNGVRITYSSSGNTTTFTGEGIGQIFTYETYADGMDSVTPGMVFVSNRDPANQVYYVRVNGYNDPNNDGVGLIFLNRSLEDMTSGDRISAIYYDKGIDIVKPLESYCNGIACNQNAYKTEIVTNADNESSIVSFTDTKYIAPLIYTSNQTSFENTHNAQSGSTNVLIGATTEQAWYWFDNLSGRNEDYEPIDGSIASHYIDDVVHVSLRSTDTLNSAMSEKGFPNTATLTGSNDYIPIGRIVGYIKIRRNSNYQYNYIIKLNPKAYVWDDVVNNDDGNPQSKQIDWTKFNTSDYWVQRWSYKNRSNRISKGANITNKTTLGNTAGSTGSDQYYKVTSSISISSAEAISWFHNPNSIPINIGSTNRVLPSDSYVRRTEISGTTKLIYFNEFSEFQGAYSVYGKHYTGTTDNGLTVTNNITNSDLRIHPIINMQNQDFSPAKRTSTNSADDPFDFIQFRSKVYEVVLGNSQTESFIPFVRFVHPFATTSGVETRIQNSMNPLTVYTFTNTTTNRELCCPPLDTSPPFDSSAIGLSTTINEPDMGIAGGLNVRVISARHPVADILEIPAGVTTSDLDVDKKLRIDFSGSKYDLLIGDSIPQDVIDGN